MQITFDNGPVDPQNTIENPEIINPMWVSVSEAAKIGGVQPKTIRRALKSNGLRFKITNNRYLIDVKSLITYLYSSKKLENKLNNTGIGQYIDKWNDSVFNQ